MRLRASWVSLPGSPVHPWSLMDAPPRFMGVPPGLSRASMSMHGRASALRRCASGLHGPPLPTRLRPGVSRRSIRALSFITGRGMKDPGASLEADTARVVDAPLSDVRLRTGLTGAELRAFLALPATQARIREVVVARLNGQVARSRAENEVRAAVAAAPADVPLADSVRRRRPRRGDRVAALAFGGRFASGPGGVGASGGRADPRAAAGPRSTCGPRATGGRRGGRGRGGEAVGIGGKTQGDRRR
jgi:hypothetical protein